MPPRRPAPAVPGPDHEALVAAIVRDPDEDTLRLAYADWLDEHGDPDRAEFIRLQIRLAADPAGRPGRGRLAARADELLDRHRADWTRGVTGPGVLDVEFERGLAAAVNSTAAAFIRCGKKWLLKHPLRRAFLEQSAGRTARLAAAAHLDAVRELWLWDDLQDEDVVALAEAPRPAGAGRYPNLESLDLHAGDAFPGVGWRGLAALARCEMPRLRKLRLTGVPGGDRGALALAGAKGFDGLEELCLSQCDVGDDGLIGLLTSPRRRGLKRLWVTSGRVTAESLNALADLPDGSPLREVSLSEIPITDVDSDRLGEALRKHPHLRLDLRACPLSLRTQRKVVSRFGDRVAVGKIPNDDVPIW